MNWHTVRTETTPGAMKAVSVWVAIFPQFIGPVKSGGWAKLMPNSLIVGEFTKKRNTSE